MQDPNHWYGLQRSNSDQHPHPIQDPPSNTSSLTPAGVHNAQALPAAYSFASAARSTHGEDFYHSPVTIIHYFVLQWLVTFLILPWERTLLMHSHNITTRMGITAPLLTHPHTRSMRPT